MDIYNSNSGDKKIHKVFNPKNLCDYHVYAKDDIYCDIRVLGEIVYKSKINSSNYTRLEKIAYILCHIIPGMAERVTGEE